MDLHPVAMDLEAHTDGMFAAADAETGMLSLWSIEFVSQGDGDEVQTTTLFLVAWGCTCGFS